MTSDWFFNPEAQPALDRPSPGDEARQFHRRLPGYAPTRCCPVTLPGLDAVVHVKDESSRFGLPAFKILGASWAAWRLLRHEFGPALDGWSDITELRDRIRALGTFELVAATAGNHGRAVARAASWFGLGARIFVPRHAAGPRVDAIAAEGATVVRSSGDYDRAVADSRAYRGEGAFLLQDTSETGDEQTAEWVIEGYSTLGWEIDDFRRESGLGGPELVIVPAGVGSLATAIVLHYKGADRRSPPQILVVEPSGSACVRAALRAGRPVHVPGPHDSPMAGLACGRIASVAWGTLSAGVDATVTVTDDEADRASVRLAAAGIESGESGAATYAALCKAAEEGLLASNEPGSLGLGPGARIQLLSTEGATDPGRYRAIVDRC